MTDRSAGRSTGSAPGRWEAADQWWTEDLEPLGGRLRLVFYSGMLLMALSGTFRSPLSADQVFAWTDPAFLTPKGLFGLTGVGWMSAGLLSAIRTLTTTAWLAAACGFLSRWSVPVAGLGFFVLHGASVAAVGVTHRWYVPVFAMLALMVAADDGRWSIDRWLASRWPRLAFLVRPRGPLMRSGFARKLFLLFAVSTLFAGGVSKVLGTGTAWMDGVSLQFFVEHSPSRWPWMAGRIVSNLELASMISIASVAFELASPVALFSRRARHLVVAGACAFHLGIFLLMHPVYWPQMWCYLLLIDWGRLGAWFRARGVSLRGRGHAEVGVDADAARTLAAEGASKQSGEGLHRTPGGRRHGLATIVGTAASAALLVVAFARVEWWPLTHVPMYSDYMGPVGTWSRSDVPDVDHLLVLGERCHYRHQCIWLPGWVDVYAVRPRGQHVRLGGLLDPRKKPPGSRGVLPKQLFRTLRDVASADLAARSASIRSSQRPADGSARDWLQRIAPAVSVAVNGKGGDRGNREFVALAILASLADRDVVLARVALEPDPQARRPGIEPAGNRSDREGVSPGQ